MADRRGHVGGRERGGRNLVKQRLESVMVLPVDDGHVDRRFCERPRCLDAAEAGADDDDLGTRVGHGRSLCHCERSEEISPRRLMRLPIEIASSPYGLLAMTTYFSSSTLVLVAGPSPTMRMSASSSLAAS